MKVTILEFNKSTTPSIDEFSDQIQKIINENNDLLEFRPYENPYNGNVKVELLFGDTKTTNAEVMAYGPGALPELLEQLNGTLTVAEHQTKRVRYAGFVPMAKSPRSVGFLVLEKGTENKGMNSSAEVNEAEKRSQDKTPNDRTTRRRKSAE